MSVGAYEAVIGLEVHVQLLTRSKIFSDASTAFGAEPNQHTNPVDLALPGTLPVLNAQAVALAVRLGHALGAQIAPRSVFARKNYFYPDSPKGYQISQFELPILVGGMLRCRLDDRVFSVQLTRAHLEEDAGKSVHDAFYAESAIDLNRAGVPLLEVVTEPVLHSAAEAVAYLKTLHNLVRWLGVCDGDMQEGSFRCDANVSVRPVGQTTLGTRSEVKNVNSFRFVEKAIEYEIERHIRVLESGGQLVQETRLFDPARGETRSMRSKEDAQDYRYFADPDLPPLILDAQMVAQIGAALPELPEAARARLLSLGLTESDADSITADRALCQYFDAAHAALGHSPKLCANWLLNEVSAALNAESTAITSSPVSASALAQLLALVEDGSLSGKLAKKVFDAMWSDSGASAAAVVERLGLKQINDSSALVGLIDQVLAEYPSQVAAYRGGQDKMLQFLIGQLMKASKGQANPTQLSALLRERLAGSDN